MINFQQFEVLSFDCYGTLINWEDGILTAIKTILSILDIVMSEMQILEVFALWESLNVSGE